ncbi:hypothetical protein GCM10027043_35120 [Ferruginibacter profundus]
MLAVVVHGEEKNISMHQQHNRQITECLQSVKGKTAFMPIGNSMPFNENIGDYNITRLCKSE